MNLTIETNDIINAIIDGSKMDRGKLVNLIAKIYAQGRKDGLKEMDEAHCKSNYYEAITLDNNPKNEFQTFIEKLRQEYAS